MADSSNQRKVEHWIRSEYLPGKFNTHFKEEKLRLDWGGYFNFDAVSDDRQIVANISTSASRTMRGGPGGGKYFKIKNDILYLLFAENVSRRNVILTEQSMLEYCKKEQSAGRLPPEGVIEFLHVELPEDMRRELEESRVRASVEVTPSELK